MVGETGRKREIVHVMVHLNLVLFSRFPVGILNILIIIRVGMDCPLRRGGPVGYNG